MAYARLAFADWTVEEQPRRVELHHAEFQHSVLTVDVPTFSVDAKRYQTGVPVLLTWGHHPAFPSYWYGYVSHTKPIYSAAKVDPQTREMRQIVCIGASFWMKNGAYLGFRDANVTTLARAIAEQFRLDTSQIQQHTRVFASLNQSGRSYWAFLVELATKVGFTVYCHGTTLYFHDRLSAVSKTTSSMPWFSPTDGSLGKFQSLIGAVTPDGGDLVDRYAYGVQAETGQPVLGQFKAQEQRPLLGSSPMTAVLQRGAADVQAGSLAEAQDTLGALAQQNQLPVVAEIEVTGTTLLRVGSAAYLRDLDLTNSGIWYVMSTVHTITGDGMTAKARVGRDALVAAVAPPAAPTFSLPNVRASQLSNYQWVAA